MEADPFIFPMSRALGGQEFTQAQYHGNAILDVCIEEMRKQRMHDAEEESKHKCRVEEATKTRMEYETSVLRAEKILTSHLVSSGRGIAEEEAQKAEQAREQTQKEEDAHKAAKSAEEETQKQEAAGILISTLRHSSFRVKCGFSCEDVFFTISEGGISDRGVRILSCRHHEV